MDSAISRFSSPSWPGGEPIFFAGPPDMEMRNEKEVITRMMNLWGEARRLTQDNRLDNGNDAETQTQFKEMV